MTLTAASEMNPADAKALEPMQPPSWQHCLQMKLQRLEIQMFSGHTVDINLSLQEVTLLLNQMRAHNRCYLK